MIVWYILLDRSFNGMRPMITWQTIPLFELIAVSNRVFVLLLNLHRFVPRDLRPYNLNSPASRPHTVQDDAGSVHIHASIPFL